MARGGESFALRIIFCLLPILLNTKVSLSSNQNNGSSFKLSIIHFSDFHSRYRPITPAAGLCHARSGDECVGGLARLATVAKRLKRIRPNAVLLNAGDFMQGTLFYEVHRSEMVAYFMNKLHHDVITIGNHDFDDEIAALPAFVKSLTTPVVLANVDCSQEPLLQNVFKNSTVIRRGGKSIGVIGVINSETNTMSPYTGKLKFLNEVDTVNSEARKLKARGVDIIVVLSHCGIEPDKIMAASCPDVDVVVGGHSHVLLYNGKPPSKDVAYDKYPIVVTQESGRKVLVVHSGPFTKYMGDIGVTFDKNNEVSSWEGNPIYLDESIEQDPSILRELKPWEVEVDRVGKQVVGETLVFLNGSCSKGECNLANLITDAMVDKYSRDASIAITASPLIQNSVPVGKILYEDIYGAMPYNDTWDLVDMKGSDLRQLIEGNAVSTPGKRPKLNSLLIHWSGLKVVYDLSKPDRMVRDIRIRCHECADKKFQALDPNEWYRVVATKTLLIPQFIANEKYRNRVVGDCRDVDIMIEYVRKITPVNVTKDSRMVFV